MKQALVARLSAHAFFARTHVHKLLTHTYAHALTRRRGCFSTEMGEFQELVKKLVDGMNKHAARIEAAKLKALGQVRV